MANEKLSILKMLEERKITAAEAARLLEAVEGPAPRPSSAPPRPASPPPRSYEGYANNGSARPSPRPTMPPPASSRGPETHSSDLGSKIGAFARDMEPKIQKITETVAEKLVSGADRISRTFTPDAPASPSPAPQRSYSPAPPKAPASPAGSGIEKNIELPVAPGYNELNLAGLNGDVRIKGYNGDKITARISYKPKRGGAEIELMKFGGKYFLKYEEDDFERVSIDAYVPERLFSVVNVSGINGNMDVSSLASQQMQFSNSNGQTRLTGCAADNIKVDCNNGKLSIGHMAAASAAIENFNGNLDAEELDVAGLKLTNYNGPLSLLVSMFNRYEEYDWTVETSNGKLTVNVPTLPDLGYHLKAHTTLGEIRVGLTGLQFLINDPALVEARSTYFDRAAKRVKLAAETSNAQLMIN
jgi:DUF4097 and DUF4098 domain-containing protein YvlB